MLVSLMFTVVFGFQLLLQTTAFKSRSRPTLLVSLSQQQQQQLSTLSASASLSAAVFPSNSVLLRQLMAASMKKKMIFLAHPIVLIVVIFLIKQMFLLLPSILPKITLFLLSLKTALGTTNRKEDKKIGMDSQGKRFYGIAQPITQERRSPRTDTVKKRMIVTTLDSKSSLEMARSRVKSIIASLEEESKKATTKENEVVLQSRHMGSWTPLVRRDVEKEGNKEAYVAKVKQMEKERKEKITKQQEAETTMKLLHQHHQQQIGEIERKRREAATESTEEIETKTTGVIHTQPLIILSSQTTSTLHWTPHMIILKS